MAIVNDVIPPFRLFQPTSLDEAAELVEDLGDEAWVMAGGMDSFDWLKDRTKRIGAIVELSQVAALRVSARPAADLEIGARRRSPTWPNIRTSSIALACWQRPRGSCLAADPQPGHHRRERVARHALRLLPRWVDMLPGGWQHLLRGHADSREPRARHPRREPLRGREPVRYGPALVALDAQMVIRRGPQQARRRRGRLLHRAGYRHHAHDGSGAG